MAARRRANLGFPYLKLTVTRPMYRTLLTQAFVSQPIHLSTMKTAMVFLAVLVAVYAGEKAPLTYTIGSLPYAGLPVAGYSGLPVAGYSGLPLAYSGLPAALPYAAYNYRTMMPDYRLQLDTTLPGSAYANFPNAAFPTAYGYGVLKKAE